MPDLYQVIPGAKSFFYKGNQIGILICHGFVGTPQSVGFLGEYLAAKGYTVYGPRLKGHGTHFREMETCSYHDWLQSLEDGYLCLKQHCQDIFIIGQSMGGTLAVNLSSKYTDIKGIILINAAMTIIPSMMEFKFKREPRFIDEGTPDIKAEGVHEIVYDQVPIRSIQQLLSLMEDTQGKLAGVTAPALAFISDEDHVVPGENTTYIMDHIQSDIKSIIRLFNSYHVASMDDDKEYLAERCCQFIEKYRCSPIKKGITST